MKKAILSLCLPIILGGCASLTQTQIEAVNQFSQTSKNFSAYPSKVMVGLIDVRVKRSIYYSNSLGDAVLHINDLDSIYASKKASLVLSQKVDITFKIIDKYAQALLLLSSDKHAADLEKQAKTFGGNLDSLINIYNSIGGVTKVPSGIGGAINQLIVFGGKQYLKAKQAKEIRKFVSQADPLVEVMTKNLLEFLQSTNINELIENEERSIRSNYLSFLRQRPATIVTMVNERDYLEMKSDLDDLKDLRDQTVSATSELRNAHKALLASIQNKKKLKEQIQALQHLYDDVKEVKETIEKIETPSN